MIVGYVKPEVKSYSAVDVIEELGPCQNQYTTTLYTQYGNNTVNANATIASKGADDGKLQMGYESEVGEFRGCLGFNLSSIASSTVVSATLKVYQFSLTTTGGNPYDNFGNVLADHINFGTSVDAGDFSGNTLTPSIGTISTDATFEWKPLDVTNYVQADLAAGRTSSQYRFRFANVFDPGKRSMAEFAGAYGGPSDPKYLNQPAELVVTYN